MSNTNNNFQTQTSNSLHNAIMEAGGKDHPPMLAPEAEAVQIILTWIDNDIYSTVDACLNNEVNEIRAERIARTANPLALIAQQQLVYDPQNHPTHYTHNSSTRSQQVATRNKGKSIVNSPPPTYDQEPEIVVEDDALSMENEIDKLMALISLSFKKIYKPTNNNLIQKVTLDAADNSRPIFDTEPLQKVQNNNDNYNVFANDREHPKQPKSVNDIYLEEQGDINITIDSLNMSTNKETVYKDDGDLARERDLLAPLIDKLKCETNDSNNCNKLLESSNKTLVDKLKGESEDFKTKNKSLESSNYHFKEANNELSKTNQLMCKDLKKFQAKLDSVGTPMATKHLDAGLSGTLVDQTKYHSMVGALIYLTTSRQGIVHETCYCARYQARPTEKHLTAVKQIFWTKLSNRPCPNPYKITGELFNTHALRGALTLSALTPNDLVYQLNQSSYKAVQYPCYVKLIISHVMATLLTILKRPNEPYNNPQDDDLILMMFTTSNPLNATAMRIPDEFLIKEIMKIEAYKDYDADYKENVTSLKKESMSEKVDKMVEGKEDDDTDFLDSLLISQEYLDTRLEPRSHKESLGEKNDNDDDQQNVDALTRRKKIDSSEIRDEENNVEKSCQIVTSLDEDVLKLVTTKTNLILKENLRRIVREEIHNENKSIIVEMKDDPQSQATDPDMWKVLREKFEKSSAPSESCRQNIFHKRDHDDHLDDDVSPEVENGAKKQNTSRRSSLQRIHHLQINQ
nr:hypothetical protein [Tanacetum cinerariifolium]